MSKQAEIATDNKELERLNAIVERGKGATVRVVRDVYPGTTVTIDQVMLLVKEEQTSVEFVKRQGNVIMTGLEGVVA